MISAARSLAALLLACAAASSPRAEDGGPGASKATAIEVCRPTGQRAYLSRLVCATGVAPEFRRVGSFGPRNDIPADLTPEQQRSFIEKMIRNLPLAPGEPDLHVVDGYELACGSERRVVYMDMYHCDKPAPSEAPSGFTLRPD